MKITSYALNLGRGRKGAKEGRCLPFYILPGEAGGIQQSDPGELPAGQVTGSGECTERNPDAKSSAALAGLANTTRPLSSSYYNEKTTRRGCVWGEKGVSPQSAFVTQWHSAGDWYHG